MRTPLFLLTALSLAQATAAPMTLRHGSLKVTLDPSTLALWRVRDGHEIPLSGGTPATPLRSLKTGPDSARWSWPARHLDVSVTLTGAATLRVDLSATSPTGLDWPLLPLARQRALILPQESGRYIPLDRPDLLADVDGLNTTEDLNMPFVGLLGKDGIQTWRLDSPFHNTLRLSKANLSIRHDFLNRGGSEAQRYELTFTPGQSPVESALVFRKYLQASGHFRSFEDKLKDVPDAAKLRGALFAYLWGSGVIGMQDVRPAAWQNLLSGLLGKGLGATLLALMDPDTRSQLKQAAAKNEMDAYVKRLMVDGVNQATARGPYAERTASAILADLRRQFPGVFVPGSEGGQGFSAAFLKELKAAGIARARLASQDASDTARHSDVVRLARDLGYLMGPYHSYGSVHPPAWAGSDRTWPTAQFPAAVYAKGGIMNANGQYVTGFQGVGRTLSAVYALPAFQVRAAANLARAPYNYYFMDVDATADVHDDYNPLHLSTARQETDARRARLKWLADRHLVVGSEGGSYLFADLIHVGEGVFTPALGRWVDPDLARKDSPFYLGAYYPADRPAVFFKTVPLKPNLLDRYYGAAYQLPLYETAFHDSLISTDHWLTPANKFSNTKAGLRARSFLYLEPLLFHISRDNFPQDKADIVGYYRRFSPLHQAFGTAPLTDFRWLTDDHLVQQTVFRAGARRLTVIANFRTVPVTVQGHRVSPQDVITLETP